MSQQTSDVIEKSVTVAAPVEHAFRVFTEEIHTWWPLSTHAVDAAQAEAAVFEGQVGGRLFERTSSGEEHVWGTVVTWEPPHRVGYTWHAGREEENAQEVEVTFTAQADGTRVDLRHWGWEKLGDSMQETVANYTMGWDVVLGRYLERANAGERRRRRHPQVRRGRGVHEEGVPGQVLRLEVPERYDSGWDNVLSRFASAAGAGGD